jgi:hypothetical protein
MLDEKPSVEKVNSWFRAQEAWAIEELPHHGVSWIANLVTPMDLPNPEPPEVPTKADFTRIEPGVNGAEDKEVFDRESFETSKFMWQEDWKQHKKDTVGMDRDIRSLYGSMRTYLAEGTRRIIETEKGHDIWGYENPVELREAIIEVFLTKNNGSTGNALDAEAQRTHFGNIKQRHGQTVTEFLSYWKEQLKSLEVMERSTGMTTAKFKELWTEKREVESFISKLDKEQGGYWLSGFRFRGVALPATMEEAFQQAVNAEKEYNNTSKPRSYETVNAYATQQKNNNTHGRSYAQATGGGAGSWQPRRQRDADGKLCCLDYLKRQKCDYGDNCRFSHKWPVAQDAQKGKGQNDMIEKAAKQTSQENGQNHQGTIAAPPSTGQVRFANESGNGNPNLGGGGAGSGGKKTSQ